MSQRCLPCYGGDHNTPHHPSPLPPQKGKTALEMAKAQGIKTALSTWKPPPPPPANAPAGDDAEPGAPLRSAADKGDLAEVLRLIRDENADVNAASGAGFTPLHCSCHKGSSDVTEELLKWGADPGALNKDVRALSEQQPLARSRAAAISDPSSMRAITRYSQCR